MYGTGNNLLLSVNADIESKIALAGVRALGLVDVHINRPLWKLLDCNDVSITDMSQYYQKLHDDSISNLVQDSSPMFDENYQMFENYPPEKDLFGFFALHAVEENNEELDVLTTQALELILASILSVIKRQLVDHLTGGKHSDPNEDLMLISQSVPKTNQSNESNFGQLDRIKRFKPNATTAHIEGMVLYVNNKTSDWLDTQCNEADIMQKDANECWTELVRCLQQKVPGVKKEPMEIGASSSQGLVDQYLSGEFDVSMKCEEAEEEVATHSTEKFYQLSCFIEKEVKYMHTGLRSRLEEHITKNSPTLGRDAVYKKSSKLKRIPAYLAIQFVRFYYKEKEAINAKILKDVKFPISLDVYDLCSEKLKEQLAPMRDRFKEQEDKKAEELQKAKVSGKTDEKKEIKLKQEPYSFPDDVGSNNSGYYELQAVLTHKGRSSSSGHYVAWVRRKGDDWYMYDDDNVSPVTAEDVLRLSGGGMYDNIL
ncbi:ubiquitin carboxyl-terminal hydrolase 14 [Mytilus galloprovincialis]|uniref:ubiquitinyl hydrolase 1 n=1 Tax=Mytilus galloprovincialis TaxID=29158 RepID=A0A8B6DD37_MYTGA|nr:ubiquitin carboxyl-terminal hydrolase 14 [Mytilus galloprovincialis]